MEKGAAESATAFRPADAVADEYRELREGAVVIEGEARLRMHFEGARAVEVVNGLVTNDVARLAEGEGLYAAALTPKGKIIADLRVFRLSDGVLADVPGPAAAGFSDMIRKYVNPRLSKYRDTSVEGTVVEVYGPRAEAVLALAAHVPGETLGIDSDFAHRELEINGIRVMLARVPDAGVPGFVIIAPAESMQSVMELLAAQGARRVESNVVEIARIEAGRPLWGRDMDDSTLVQEANLDELGAISYDKGCYTGQETVARVHFRGHVNRHLRGLRLSRDDVPAAATLWQLEGEKQVGDLRSTAHSPRLGPIALGMVRREINPGDVLLVKWEGGDARASVDKLPFA